MRKFFLIIVAALAFVTVSAQPPQGRGGQGGPNRNARLLENLQRELGMTAQQAQKFAPVYQGYMREIRNVRKETKAVVDSYKSQEMTTKVAKKIMLAQLNGDKQIISVKKEYIKVFVNYLSPEQLSKVFTIGQRPRGARPGARPGAGQQGQQGQQPRYMPQR